MPEPTFMYLERKVLAYSDTQIKGVFCLNHRISAGNQC